jgi:threonylcarbamoyladenosine tRNA methylthiotransferase MtaB
MKVCLRSLGCRLNQSEIDTLARQLVAAGHALVDDPAHADTIVVNTCAVTAEAARDSRRLARRLHRSNAQAEIVVTGCHATLAPAELAALPGVARVVPNERKDRLIDLFAPEVGDHRDSPVPPSFPPGERGRPARKATRQPGVLAGRMPALPRRTRAFVKVQEGCDKRCTFCVTTVARGASRSRHLGDVVAEVRALVVDGYQEVVLTGVHLGSFGRDLGGGADLGALIRAILDRTDIPRLRLSSLEPWDLAPDFFELWANPRLLPHLHLPLQSGSDRVLARMARQTTRGEFRTLVGAARAAIPELGLSTDVIAGFPGESEGDFEESLDFVGEIGFARLHVFGYSPRPGTAAARMADHVPEPARRERVRRMIALGQAQSLAFHRRHAGRTLEVLWEAGETAEDGLWRGAGYTRNYIHVTTTHAGDLRNRVTAARLADPDVAGLRGVVC